MTTSEHARAPSKPTLRDGSATPRRVARSSALLVTQYGSTTVLSALTTVGLTRLLLPTGYGAYAAAIAAWTVLGSTADLGTSTLLARDLGSVKSRYRPMLRAAYQVAGMWSLVLTLVLIVLGLAAGIDTTRGQALLVLAPSMAFNGLNPATGVFVASYETKRLLHITVCTNTIQTILCIAVAGLGFGVVAVAAGVSLMSIVTSILIAVAAQRVLPAPTPSPTTNRWALVKRSVPLAVLAVLTRVYGMIDLVILSWFVTGPRLGEYAVAAKVMAVLAGVAAQVMSGALPGLAGSFREDRNVTVLSARVWHWLLVCVLPLFAAVGLFASIVIRVFMGQRYEGAVVLLQILALYGALAVGTNLAGNILVAAGRMRALYLQSTLAIVVNVAANLILIPRYGVYASAWITVGTELLVCTCAFASARDLLSLSSMVRVAIRPLAALAVASALAAYLIQRTEAGAVAVFFVILVGALLLTKSWPEEFIPGRLRRT